MSALLVIAGGYVLFLATWLFYLAVMNLADKRAEMHWFAKLNAYILLAIGYPLDILLNGVTCLIFWRVPKDVTLTYTLKRIQNTETGWRETVAAWVCAHLLNPFDPKGKHC